MGRILKSYYSAEVSAVKQSYYINLPEKGKRHFLGQEYICLGSGSQRYLSMVYGCSRDTIRKGYQELLSSPSDQNYSKQRKEGGGRKKKS